MVGLSEVPNKVEWGDYGSRILHSLGLKILSPLLFWAQILKDVHEKPFDNVQFAGEAEPAPAAERRWTC
ncbi:hypothetical protein M0R45_034674 [Rubus argutus]|uniref:Uncharacterized protein n=1 Tax=Rubus argutus TaxID=59490 RepID=A0AAW1VT92_RUBAR